MADADLARLNVRIAAETSRFQQGTARVEATFSRFANSTEARAARLDARLSAVGSRFGAGFGTKIQQVGFQVGDVATQMAAGTNMMRAMTMQVGQLLGAFGPLGAVAGAAATVVGALAMSMSDSGDAADDAADGADRASDAFSGLEGGVNGLIAVVDAYIDAIGGTADAQVGATDVIVAQTEREFNAKKRLLELEQRRAMITQAENLSQIVDLRARQGELSTPARDVDEMVQQRLREIEAGTGRTPNAAQIENIRQSYTTGAFANEERERQEALRKTADELTELEANADLLGIKLQQVGDALALPFEDMVAQRQAEKADRPSRSGGAGGGGGGRSRRDRDPAALDLSALRERNEQLRHEAELIGLTEARTVRKRAEYEAERIALAALNKVREDGREPTQQEITDAQTLAATYAELTVANWSAEEAMKAQADAAADAKQRQEQLARSITDVADRLIGAVQQADSFADALKNIGLELLRLSVQGLGGQGPLGGLLGNIIPSLFGGGSFSSGFSGTAGSLISGFGGGIAGAGSFVPSARGNVFAAGNVIPFARGGVVNGPTTFPMPGGMGLMGEAGPEAIMPLRRGPGGRLGVEAAGGGASRIVVELSPDLTARVLRQAHQQSVQITRKGMQQTVQGIVERRAEDPHFLR